MEPRFYQDFTDFWRQAQWRMWASSLNLNGPNAWAKLWNPADWNGVAWNPFLPRPSTSSTGRLAEQSAQQLQKNLSPERYLPLLKIGTRNVQTCLDIQQKMWQHWFEILEQGTKTLASWNTTTESAAPRSNSGARPRRAGAGRASRKSQSNSKPAAQPKAETVQLELQSSDDLKKINGIGPGLEKQLKRQGIVSYRQIAELSPRDVERLESTVIKFPGRILRDNWIGQAKALCGA